MKKSFSIPNILYCDINNKRNLNECHLVNEARILPCNKTVCLKCLHEIKSEKGLIECPFCHKKHSIRTDLRRNMMVERVFDDEIESLSAFQLLKLKSKVSWLKEIVINRNRAQENLFEFMRDNLEIKIESIKFELDSIKHKLYKKLNEMHKNTAVNIKSFEKCVDENYEIYKKMNRIESGRSKHSVILKLLSEEQVLNKQMCLKNAESNGISIDKNKMIGVISHAFFYKLDDDRLQKRLLQPILFNIPGFQPSSYCKYIENQLIFVDYKANQLVVMKMNSKFVRKIEQIDQVKLYRPTQVCVDEANQRVILSISKDQNESEKRILVLSIHLDTILYQIDKSVNKLFDNPLFVSFEHTFLYVVNKVYENDNDLFVFVYDSKLILCNQIVIQNVPFDLSTISSSYLSSTIYFDMSLNDKYLAINYAKKSVFLFNLKNGHLESTITNVNSNTNETVANFNSIYIKKTSDSVDHNNCCLYVHINEFFSDKLQCFEKIATNETVDRPEWKLKYEIDIRQLSERLNFNFYGSIKMNVIENRLFILVYGCLVVII
jgi:hypothetical protein